jgi:FAD/FMN-containing dehydrogenase
MALSDMTGFVSETRAEIERQWPGGHIWHFGHAGDGNLHVMVAVGKGDKETELRVDEVIYSAVGRVKGSIAAELGVGREKQPFIEVTRTPEEMDLMRTIKRALDPGNILNPGVVFQLSGAKA